MQEILRRVYAAIRATATDGVHLVLVQGELQGTFHFGLYTWIHWLPLPATVSGAVETYLQEIAGKDLHRGARKYRGRSPLKLPIHVALVNDDPRTPSFDVEQIESAQIARDRHGVDKT